MNRAAKQRSLALLRQQLASAESSAEVYQSKASSWALTAEGIANRILALEEELAPRKFKLYRFNPPNQPELRGAWFVGDDAAVEGAKRRNGDGNIEVVEVEESVL